MPSSKVSEPVLPVSLRSIAPVVDCPSLTGTAQTKKLIESIKNMILTKRLDTMIENE
jgi:hypothetical protein